LGAARFDIHGEAALAVSVLPAEEREDSAGISSQSASTRKGAAKEVEPCSPVR